MGVLLDVFVGVFVMGIVDLPHQPRVRPHRHRPADGAEGLTGDAPGDRSSLLPAARRRRRPGAAPATARGDPAARRPRAAHAALTASSLGRAGRRAGAGRLARPRRRRRCSSSSVTSVLFLAAPSTRRATCAASRPASGLRGRPVHRRARGALRRLPAALPRAR
ncbi:MAG: hypothetical protein MZU95_04645 [Desulfomicrobium escambiense]|nr:hypothetical protein [Desulfomicrobium escambiense]